MFNLNNFVFVVATDTEQLQHSIKSVYGEGFDSRLYLTRFFDRTFKLPEPSLEEFLTYKKFFDLDELFGKCYVAPLAKQREADFYRLLASLCEAYELTLRDIDKLAAKLNACFRWVLSQQQMSSLNLVCLIHALIEQQSNPSSYRELPSIVVQAFKQDVIENLKSMSTECYAGSASSMQLVTIVIESFKMQKELDKRHALKLERKGVPERINHGIDSLVKQQDWLDPWITYMRENKNCNHISMKAIKELVEMSICFSE